MDCNADAMPPPSFKWNNSGQTTLGMHYWNIPNIIPLVPSTNHDVNVTTSRTKQLSSSPAKTSGFCPTVFITLALTTHIMTVTSQWARWRLIPPASQLFTQPFIQAQMKENIKAPRHCPLWGEFTGDQWWSSLRTHICVTRPQWVKIALQQLQVFSLKVDLQNCKMSATLLWDQCFKNATWHGRGLCCQAQNRLELKATQQLTISIVSIWHKI